MSKIFAMIFTGIIVSFYYFPFEFSFLPGINTKMGLALVGVCLAVLNLAKKREIKFPQNLLNIEIVALIVSLVGVISVTTNNTSDNAYATYFVSMTVWLSGAYSVCSLIKWVHKKVSVENITAYLTVVCVVQCLLALMINSNLTLKNVIDTYVMQDQLFLSDVERLYGIGASLDTAGVRFSACLIMLMFVFNKNKSQMNRFEIILSIVAYLWISAIGNMIARTTIIGVGVSIFYALMVFRSQNVNLSLFRVARICLMILIVAIPLCKYLYDNSPQFYELSRFAFEGFFNLAENGEWEIDSNEKLKSMIIFPDNLKTWVIGDGYFENPYYTDPYYVGYQPGGYYMGTDIGYCRFIFYFGLVGLLSFIFFLVTGARECILLLPQYKMLILFVLLLGFIIWLKVATDIFLVLALLLCIGNMQDETPQLEEEV